MPARLWRLAPLVLLLLALAAEASADTVSDAELESLFADAKSRQRLEDLVRLRADVLRDVDWDAREAEDAKKEAKFRQMFNEEEFVRFDTFRMNGFKLRLQQRYEESAAEYRKAMRMYAKKVGEPWADIASLTRVGQMIEARYTLREELNKRKHSQPAQSSFRQREQQDAEHARRAFDKFSQGLHAQRHEQQPPNASKDSND